MNSQTSVTREPRIVNQSCPLRRISCHGRNYSQSYFFKRNQSSDNRSHGFGAKFLLKTLSASASDFSYERKSAFSRTRKFLLKVMSGILSTISQNSLFVMHENVLLRISKQCVTASKKLTYKKLLKKRLIFLKNCTET